MINKPPKSWKQFKQALVPRLTDERSRARPLRSWCRMRFNSGVQRVGRFNPGHFNQLGNGVQNKLCGSDIEENILIIFFYFFTAEPKNNTIY